MWAFVLLVFGEGLAENETIKKEFEETEDPDAMMEEVMETLSDYAEDDGIDSGQQNNQDTS